MAEGGYTGWRGSVRPAGGEEFIYAERAGRLGLPFVRTPQIAPIRGDEADLAAAISGRLAASGLSDGHAYLAPEAGDLEEIGQWIDTHPDLVERLKVSTPTAIRSSLIAAGGKGFVQLATSRLSDWRPDLSARRAVTRGQAILSLALILIALVSLYFDPTGTLAALNLAGASVFLGITLVRFAAGAVTTELRKRPPFRPDRSRDDALPVYSVLVPLYGEAAVAADLVAALGRLDWPRDRLDIKLIVEEDDPKTRAAVESLVDGSPYEVIVVPPAEPRTKPKALAFALPFAEGEFVTIYDAEDRPHPLQLREAFQTFSEADPSLGCLQAPVLTDNQQAGLIAEMFSIEYSALFDGVLPTLTELGLPLPLGGTSNHFRRNVLEAVGGWDPFNVTEDADLGIRLARFGYRAATISLPTYEEAPASLGPWMKQRTRWLKGWLQTWFVHMRDPLRLVRETGIRQALGFNLIGMGMIVSILIHPVYLVTLAILVIDPLLFWREGGSFAAATIGVNLFNLVAGHLAMIFLAQRTLALRRQRLGLAALAALPLYWLLMSLAGYRAIFQFLTRPHFWEKTPHLGRRAFISRRQPE